MQSCVQGSLRERRFSVESKRPRVHASDRSPKFVFGAKAWSVSNLIDRVLIVAREKGGARPSSVVQAA